MSSVADRIGVIGGGIVGLAVARELLARSPGVNLVVVEKDRARPAPDLAQQRRRPCRFVLLARIAAGDTVPGRWANAEVLLCRSRSAS